MQQNLLRHADISTTVDYGGTPMENRSSANSKVVEMVLNRKSYGVWLPKAEPGAMGAR